MKNVAILVTVLLFTQCEWFKPKDVPPNLPEQTQSGANTFGCLINGQVFTPKSCGVGLSSLRVDYDPTLPGSQGRLGVSAYLCQGNGRYESVAFTIDSARADTEYSYGPWDGKRLLILRFKYFSQKKNCEINSTDKDTGRDTSIYCSGKVMITKLDRIAAGTFEFTLYKPGCDTIKITQGRFDKKL